MIPLCSDVLSSCKRQDVQPFLQALRYTMFQRQLLHKLKGLCLRGRGFRSCLHVCPVMIEQNTAALKYSHFPLHPSSGYSSSLDGHLVELCLTAVKFARKKGNIGLASRLLSQCSGGTHEEKGDDTQDDLSNTFRRLSLEGTLAEKWGSELQIEKAKVLRNAGEKKM